MKRDICVEGFYCIHYFYLKALNFYFSGSKQLAESCVVVVSLSLKCSDVVYFIYSCHLRKYLTGRSYNGLLLCSPRATLVLLLSISMC